MWVYHDGGRAFAGYKGQTGDCVTRAIAIATGKPYGEVYALVNSYGRSGEWHPDAVNARTGVAKTATRAILADLGWVWVPTMFPPPNSKGTTVHLRTDELPGGRLVVQCSRHVVAVIDGVVYDTGDPTRGGTRCVYGYWFPSPAAYVDLWCPPPSPRDPQTVDNLGRN
jgi:hypothetical protein